MRSHVMLPLATTSTNSLFMRPATTASSARLLGRSTSTKCLPVPTASSTTTTGAVRATTRTIPTSAGAGSAASSLLSTPTGATAASTGLRCSSCLFCASTTTTTGASSGAILLSGACSSSATSTTAAMCLPSARSPLPLSARPSSTSATTRLRSTAASGVRAASARPILCATATTATILRSATTARAVESCATTATAAVLGPTALPLPGWSDPLHMPTKHLRLPLSVFAVAENASFPQRAEKQGGDQTRSAQDQGLTQVSNPSNPVDALFMA
uniref:Uncharacterized protein n=1 Tax=Bursaphelenchus xylophilus TaxID=6326 RepID=A0A1I7RU75_BURXY